MIDWAAGRKIFFTRARPYKKNDQATIESKNNHLVRQYAFYWRYDTPEALVLLNQLWELVNDRLNYLTPTIKPTGYATDRNGRRKRLYDNPAPHSTGSWTPTSSHQPRSRESPRTATA